MESQNQFSKWMAMLVVLAVCTTEAMAQGPYPDNAVTQTVSFNSNQPYGVVNNPTSTYTWTITPASGGTITGNTNIISVHWTAAGIYTLQVVERNSLLCEGEPVIITVTVTPELISGTASADQTICYNTAAEPLTSVDPSGGSGTFTYQWESSADNLNFSPINGATASTYAPGILTTTTFYRLIQTAGINETVTTNVVTITVEPLPATSQIYHN